jgi:hypothetical protein
MKSTHCLTFVVLLLISATLNAYEFDVRSPARETRWSESQGDWLEYTEVSDADVTGEHRVTMSVKPEECRFYLTYDDEGRDHEALLEQARLIGGQLSEALADVEQAKVEILPLDYSPGRSWHGFFVGEKPEISVTFRVTITLATEGNTAFWENAEAVARVLQRITGLKNEAEWGKKLTVGRVAYAVESLEPTKAVLHTKVEEEVKTLRESLFAANGNSRSGVFCKIEYGNPSSSRVTLEEVEVVLPYSVEIVLRDQED